MAKKIAKNKKSDFRSKKGPKKAPDRNRRDPYLFLFITLLEILIILTATAIFCFWWYQWRPSKIISACSLEAERQAVEKNEEEGGPEGRFRSYDRKKYYDWCLQENGLRE